MILKDADYQAFLTIINQEDKNLYEISNLFSELSSEAKRMLDDIKGKSDERKRNFGAETEESQVVNHHKSLPQEVKE